MGMLWSLSSTSNLFTKMSEYLRRESLTLHFRYGIFLQLGMAGAI
jgi:hypothetical protein